MSDHDPPVIGIVGAGKLGTVLARLALGAGYDVLLASSGPPQRLALIAQFLAPGAETVTADDAIRRADVVILAVPLSRVPELPPADLAGKVVVDATNHWLEVDGPRQEILPDAEGTSEYVQRLLPQARVVKAFNHIGYHDLDGAGRPPGDPRRRAVAIASDDHDALDVVAELVDGLGFDPVALDDLQAGRRLEPGTPAFGASLSASDLRTVLGEPVRHPDAA
jgi:predicted dinucleotide-binding enzyme